MGLRQLSPPPAAGGELENTPAPGYLRSPTRVTTGQHLSGGFNLSPGRFLVLQYLRRVSKPPATVALSLQTFDCKMHARRSWKLSKSTRARERWSLQYTSKWIARASMLILYVGSQLPLHLSPPRVDLQTEVLSRRSQAGPRLEVREKLYFVARIVALAVLCVLCQKMLCGFCLEICRCAGKDSSLQRQRDMLLTIP